MNPLAFILRHKVALLVFALALVARLFYLGLSLGAHDQDLIASIRGADGYFAISQNILAGNGYSWDEQPPYTLNSVRPPVMPYFLAATAALPGGYVLTLILHLIIASLLPVLAMCLSRYIVPHAGVAFSVGLFLALEPFSILFSTVFYSETVFMLLFFLSVLFLFKHLETGRWFDLGVSASFLGFAALTKPTVQYLPLFLAGYLLWHHRRLFPYGALSRAAAYLSIFFMVIMPWGYRNYAQFGAFGISSLQGAALYSVLVPSVLSVVNGTTWGEEFEAALARDAKDPNLSSVADNSLYTAKAVRILLQHPVALAVVSANTSLNFFIHDGVYDVLRHLKIRPDRPLGGPALFLAMREPGAFVSAVIYYAQSPFLLVLLGRLLWITVTILFFLGAVRYLIKERRSAGIVALIIVFYFLLTTLSIGLAVNARYRLPVNPLIVTLALYGTLPLIHKIRTRYDV